MPDGGGQEGEVILAQIQVFQGCQLSHFRRDGTGKGETGQTQDRYPSRLIEIETTLVVILCQPLPIQVNLPLGIQRGLFRLGKKRAEFPPLKPHLIQNSQDGPVRGQGELFPRPYAGHRRDSPRRRAGPHRHSALRRQG